MGTPISKVKKGDTVMLCMFTGLRAGPKEVIACDSKTITISRKRKGEAVFDRKTGKLIKPKPENERYASYIEEDDGTFVHPMHKKTKAKKSKKAAAKKAKPEAEVEEEEVEEVEETPVPKKAASKKKKATSKKKPEPEVEEEEEFDDEDFEEVE